MGFLAPWAFELFLPESGAQQTPNLGTHSQTGAYWALRLLLLMKQDQHHHHELFSTILGYSFVNNEIMKLTTLICGGFIVKPSSRPVGKGWPVPGELVHKCTGPQGTSPSGQQCNQARRPSECSFSSQGLMDTNTVPLWWGWGGSNLGPIKPGPQPNRQMKFFKHFTKHLNCQIINSSMIKSLNIISTAQQRGKKERL